jgi:hypothetical protein
MRDFMGIPILSLFLSLFFLLPLPIKGDDGLVGVDHFGEKTTGETVVNKAVALVAQIFFNTHLPNISIFLKRIARAESDFGRHQSTFRKDYYGGIWQVDEIGFDETQNIQSHPKLAKLHKTIHEKLALEGVPDVNWKEIGWEACLIPIYSCLAARLYLAAIPEAIPHTLEGQAQYWKKYYNREAGSGTVQYFIKANRHYKDHILELEERSLKNIGC